MVTAPSTTAFPVFPYPATYPYSLHATESSPLPGFFPSPPPGFLPVPPPGFFPVPISSTCLPPPPPGFGAPPYGAPPPGFVPTPAHALPPPFPYATTPSSPIPSTVPTYTPTTAPPPFSFGPPPDSSYTPTIPTIHPAPTPAYPFPPCLGRGALPSGSYCARPTLPSTIPSPSMTSILYPPSQASNREVGDLQRHATLRLIDRPNLPPVAKHSIPEIFSVSNNGPIHHFASAPWRTLDSGALCSKADRVPVTLPQIPSSSPSSEATPNSTKAAPNWAPLASDSSPHQHLLSPTITSPPPPPQPTRFLPSLTRPSPKLHQTATSSSSPTPAQQYKPSWPPPAPDPIRAHPQIIERPALAAYQTSIDPTPSSVCGFQVEYLGEQGAGKSGNDVHPATTYLRGQGSNLRCDNSYQPEPPDLTGNNNGESSISSEQLIHKQAPEIISMLNEMQGSLEKMLSICSQYAASNAKRQALTLARKLKRSEQFCIVPAAPVLVTSQVLDELPTPSTTSSGNTTTMSTTSLLLPSVTSVFSVSASNVSSTPTDVAPQVFGESPKPRPSSRKNSSPLHYYQEQGDSFQSTLAPGGNSNITEQNRDVMPQPYGLNNLSHRRLCRSDGSEHSYYALPENYPFTRATGAPVFNVYDDKTEDCSNLSLDVFADIPEQSNAFVNVLGSTLELQLYQEEQQKGDQVLKWAVETDQTTEHVSYCAIEQEQNGVTTSVNVQQLKAPTLNLLMIEHYLKNPLPQVVSGFAFPDNAETHDSRYSKFPHEHGIQDNSECDHAPVYATGDGQHLKACKWNILSSKEGREVWDPGALTTRMTPLDNGSNSEIVGVCNKHLLDIPPAKPPEKSASAHSDEVLKIKKSVKQTAYLQWDPGILSLMKLKFGHTAVPNLVCGETPCKPLFFIGQSVNLNQGISLSAYPYILDFLDTQLEFTHQQGVLKNHNAERLLSLQNYHQLSKMDIIFITFLPP